MWGAWWVWDARLTSVLVLFFLYLGYIALVNAFDDRSRGARAGALLALVGVVNLPIIKFSVDWWNTLHQPASVVRIGGPSIALSMLLPLLVMASAFTLLFCWLLLLRMRTALNQRKIEALRLHTPAMRGDIGDGPSDPRRPSGAALRPCHGEHVVRPCPLARPMEFDGRIRGVRVAGLCGRGRGARRSRAGTPGAPIGPARAALDRLSVGPIERRGPGR